MIRLPGKKEELAALDLPVAAGGGAGTSGGDGPAFADCSRVVEHFLPISQILEFHSLMHLQIPKIIEKGHFFLNDRLS